MTYNQARGSSQGFRPMPLRHQARIEWPLFSIAGAPRTSLSTWDRMPAARSSSALIVTEAGRQGCGRDLGALGRRRLCCQLAWPRLNDEPGGNDFPTFLTEIRVFSGDHEAGCNGSSSEKVEQPAVCRLVVSRRWPAALLAMIGSARAGPAGASGRKSGSQGEIY